MAKGMFTKKEAVKIVEESIQRHPEIKVIQAREYFIESQYISAPTYFYCQTCDEWTPKEPPEIVALHKEWKRIFDREVERVWMTKAAA
jgi:hypothetical protein